MTAEVKRGLRFTHRWPDGSDGAVRVMAVADGYSLVRRPGCLPFVLHIKDVEADLSRERADDR